MNRSRRICALALFSAVVLLSAQTIFAAVTLPANGLMAHLPGDGNDGDVTGNTNGGNGAYSGPYSAGFSGQAFDIAGDEDRDFAIDDPNHVLSPLGGPVGSGGTGAITIGGWTKWTGGAGFLGLIYKHGATRTMALQSSRVAGGLDFAVVGGSGTSNNRSITETYNDGQWHSFIAVFEDNVMSAGNADTHILYIDGGANNGGETVQSPNNADGNPSSDIFNAGNDPFYQIGNYNPPDANGAWPGMIDEVFFYDRALTEAEVIAISNIPEPSAFLLLGLGAASLALFRRRQNPPVHGR